MGVLFGYYNSPYTSLRNVFNKHHFVPFAIASGDFNNDTRLDIVLAFSNTNNIGIRCGYGDGAFESQTIICNW